MGAGLGLDKFAAAGAKQYDKRAKLDKERALNAAKVNAYKKLKKRLGDKLEPRRPLEQVRRDVPSLHEWLRAPSTRSGCCFRR